MSLVMMAIAIIMCTAPAVAYGSAMEVWGTARADLNAGGTNRARGRTFLRMHNASGNITVKIQAARGTGANHTNVAARTFEGRAGLRNNQTGATFRPAGWTAHQNALTGTNGWQGVSQHTRTGNPVNSQWRAFGEIRRGATTWGLTQSPVVIVPRR